MTTPIPPIPDTGPLETMATGHELPTYGIGLLGATGSNMIQLEGNRLEVIERRILGIEASLRAAGYAIVPVEPTDAMIDAGDAVEMVDAPDCDPPVELANTSAIYRAMVSAAPLNTKEGE